MLTTIVERTIVQRHYHCATGFRAPENRHHCATGFCVGGKIFNNFVGIYKKIVGDRIRTHFFGIQGPDWSPLHHLGYIKSDNYHNYWIKKWFFNKGTSEKTIKTFQSWNLFLNTPVWVYYWRHDDFQLSFTLFLSAKKWSYFRLKIFHRNDFYYKLVW